MLIAGKKDESDSKGIQHPGQRLQDYNADWIRNSMAL